MPAGAGWACVWQIVSGIPTTQSEARTIHKLYREQLDVDLPIGAKGHKNTASGTGWPLCPSCEK